MVMWRKRALGPAWLAVANDASAASGYCKKLGFASPSRQFSPFSDGSREQRRGGRGLPWLLHRCPATRPRRAPGGDRKWSGEGVERRSRGGGRRRGERPLARAG